MIDEIDRTDEAFEAFLLEVLADFQVTVPELGTVKAPHPPIVVVTSNRTREVHDALKRRCLYHWVGYPNAERELKILRTKVPGIAKKLSEQVVAFVQALRKEDLFKSPGVAETLDWASALTELDVVALDPATVSDTLGVLLKYQDDITRLDGTKVKALLDGGVDLLIIETVFDTLNGKAALFATSDALAETNRSMPLMISGTVIDKSGRNLSGQTVEAFLISIEHAQPLIVGLNCSLGPDEMEPFIEELSRIAPFYVSAYPNAGLPDPLSPTGFPETPETFAPKLAAWVANGWLNTVGGCCGTTPEHIRAIADRVRDHSAVLDGRVVSELLLTDPPQST